MFNWDHFVFQFVHTYTNIGVSRVGTQLNNFLATKLFNTVFALCSGEKKDRKGISFFTDMHTENVLVKM